MPRGFAAQGKGMAIRTMDPQALNRLLDELDIRSKHSDGKTEQESYWVCQRHHPRHPFRADCKVRFLPTDSFSVAELPGRTRNLSRGGLGFLVSRVFALGDPIEVEVKLPDRRTMFLAGLTRFCRYAGRGYHEVGIVLKAASPEPIFSESPSLALRTLDWLNRERSP